MLCAARYRTASDAWQRPFEIAGVVFSLAILIAAARIWAVWAGVERDARAGLVASERGEPLARADLDGGCLRTERGRVRQEHRRGCRALACSTSSRVDDELPMAISTDRMCTCRFEMLVGLW